MTRCLVLGGGGFLGSHICEALLKAGHSVRTFEKERVSRENVRTFFRELEWTEGDFTDPHRIAEVLRGMEVVVHCIGTTLPKSSNENPVYDISSNLVPTLHLLDAAVHAGVRKVLFLSSGGTVYGIPQRVPIPEDHPTEPLTSYGIQKLSIEKYLKLYRHLHGLDYSVMRISNPYGERQRPNASQGAVTVFLYKAMKREPIEIWGDGSVVRDYLHVSDVARAALALLEYKGEFRTFNVGSGAGLSLLQVVESIRKVLGHPVETLFRPPRPFDVPVNILDISRAARELSWRPSVAFDDGLRRSLAYLSQPGPG
ncbi:MAG: UDP-glucose [Planctomycetota bacterium]|nr:MAG: UDP-glucose [Planctomycetota bacterium]